MKLPQNELDFLQSQIDKTLEQNKAGGIDVLVFQLYVSQALHKRLGDTVNVNGREIEVVASDQIKDERDGKGYFSDVYLVAKKWIDSWDGNTYEREGNELPKYGIDDLMNNFLS